MPLDWAAAFGNQREALMLPVRPFLLVVDGRYPRPPEAFASYPDAIAERARSFLERGAIGRNARL